MIRQDTKKYFEVLIIFDVKLWCKSHTHRHCMASLKNDWIWFAKEELSVEAKEMKISRPTCKSWLILIFFYLLHSTPFMSHIARGILHGILHGLCREMMADMKRSYKGSQIKKMQANRDILLQRELRKVTKLPSATVIDVMVCVHEYILPCVACFAPLWFTAHRILWEIKCKNKFLHHCRPSTGKIRFEILVFSI